MADATITPADVELTPVRTWQSDTGGRYPVQWTLDVPHLGLQLEVEAAFDDQAMQHTVRYWEGAVIVSGSHPGRGYLELSGYAGSASASVADQATQTVDRQ